MSRTGGRETKDRILEAAEKLFSENGYEGTGVEAIARAVGVNRASLYYHFRSKREILDALTRIMMAEVRKIVQASVEAVHEHGKAGKPFKEYVHELIEVLLRKKDLARIIMMESLKTKDGKPPLFECAELLMDHHADGLLQVLRRYHDKAADDTSARRVFEFYTGFIPIFSFILFADTWTAQYGLTLKKLTGLFIESFGQTHMSACGAQG